MALLDYVDPVVFLVALCIGLFYTYYVTPVPQIIIKYPTPFNVGKILYTDNAGTCYKFKIKKADCPYDKSKIKTFSPQ